MMKAGFGDRVITPSPPFPLVGYGIYLGRKANSVLDDLKVRTLFLEDLAGTRCLIAAYDLIGFSINFSDHLKFGIEDRFGLPAENILLSFTHTHSGPPSMFLRGMGNVDKDYLAAVSEKTFEAVEDARKDLQPAEIRWNIEEIEPIGFNRVNGTLEPVDTQLGILAFEREDLNIYLANYACHPVTLGRNTAVSADFPGRFCGEIEKEGDRLLFMQGFCGNIDPFRNKVRWGAGTEKDIQFYGKHLASRFRKALEHRRPMSGSVIKARLERIGIPYDICPVKDIQKEAGRLLDTFKDFEKEKSRRFADEWLKDAKTAFSVLKEKPFLENVPVQILKLGEVNIAALPGEVFCELGLTIKDRFPGTFPAGYANGNIGYIPTAAAYKKERDYACYSAPKFYAEFPYKDSIEALFTKTVLDMLEEVR